MATYQKKYITDENGNKVLPITSTSAVKDNNGTTVDTLLANTNDAISNESSRATQAESTLQNNINAETSRAQAAESSLQQLYQSLTQSSIEVVNSVPASGVANKIYRVVGTNSYSDYMFNAADLNTAVKMAEYNNAIDDEPTAGSDNLVKSGGVHKQIQSLFTASNVRLYRKLGYKTGALITDETKFIEEDYIPVNAGDSVKWVFSHGETDDNSCLIFYDGDKNLIETWGSRNTSTGWRDITAPENSAYLRASFFIDAIDIAKVTINGVIVYEPNGGISSKFIQAVRQDYLTDTEKEIVRNNINASSINEALNNYIIGEGSNLVLRDIYGLVPNKSYIFHISQNWVINEISSTYNAFVIWNVVGTNATVIFEALQTTTFKGSEYIITIPDPSDHLRIGARAAEGTKGGFFIQPLDDDYLDTPRKATAFATNKGYYTITNNKVVYATNNQLRYNTIPYKKDYALIVKGFTFVPSTSNENTYFRIIAADSSGNVLLDSINNKITLNNENNIVLSDLPDGTSLLYVDIPVVHLDELTISYGIKEFLLPLAKEIHIVTSLSEDYGIRKQQIDLKNDTVYGSIQPNGAISVEKTDITTDFIPTKGGILTFSVPTFQIDNTDYTFTIRVVAMEDKDNTGSTLLFNHVGFTATGLDETINVDTKYKYIRVSYYGKIKGTTTRYTGDIIKNLPEGTFAIITYPSGNYLWDIQKKTESEKELEEIKKALLPKTDIVSLNGNISNILLPQFKKDIRHLDGTLDSYKPLVLLHFSDIHGSEYNLKRIMDYHTQYNNYIDDVIHTGDMLAMQWEHDFTFWHNSNADNVLNTIGNHDTAYYDSETGFDWYRYVNLDSYNRYFAPYIRAWNVVQPENASILGLCYYYKDYTNSNIRLIVIDDMNLINNGTAQIEWFNNVVDDSLENNLQLIVCGHHPNKITPIECPFHCIGSESRDSSITFQRNAMLQKIDEFITNGGKFITWLTGHTHRDMIGLIQNTAKPQLSITVSTSAYLGQSIFDNIDRKKDTKSADLFNIVKVDPYNKRLSLYRVGSDYDSDGRHIGTVTVDYILGTIINKW